MSRNAIYKKIVDLIKSEIENGKIALHQLIYSEAQLADMFNVSRNTVIKALDQLSNEGFIYRVQGKGSFVAERKADSGNYRPSKTVSLILPFSYHDSNRIDEFNVIRGVENYLKSNGYNLLIYFGTDEPEEEAKIIDKYRHEMVDGVIVYPTTLHNNFAFLYGITLDEYPIVFIDRGNSDLPIPCVQSDNIKGGFEAVSYLLSRGYEDIYFISDVKINMVSAVRERYFGYCKAIRHGGKAINNDLFIDGYAMKDMKYKPFSYEDNPEAFKRIMDKMVNYSRDKKIGIFTDNDLVAYSLINAALDLGLSVPEKIGIIGFNDADIASKSIIPITTVRQNFYEIGRLAAKTIIEKMGKKNGNNLQMLVGVELIVRNSTI